MYSVTLSLSIGTTFWQVSASATLMVERAKSAAESFIVSSSFLFHLFGLKSRKTRASMDFQRYNFILL